MMTNLQINEYWKNELGKSDRPDFRNNEILHKYKELELMKFDLSSETKNFLVEVGFFTTDKNYLNTELKKINILCENFIQITNQYHSSERMICISEEDEKVYFLSKTKNSWRKELWNLDISKYMQFITIKFALADKFGDILYDDEFDSQIFKTINYEYARKVIEEFKKIDNDVIYINSHWVQVMTTFVSECCFEVNYIWDILEKFTIDNGFEDIDYAQQFAVINGLESICCDWINYI